jgi:hypothetical protein
MKRLALIASLPLLGLAPAAAAEPFVSEYVLGPKTVIVSPNPHGGAPLLAGHWRATAVTTYKSGAVTRSTYECVAWSTPGAQTSSAALCGASDNAVDTYTISLVCQDPADIKDMAAPRYCWGPLTGTGGRYAGKHGVYTIIGFPKSGSGQGAWAD